MITILGPTATGKTQLAAELSANIDAEVISADSRQVYRRMDIGTGKDLGDYVVQGKCVPYHLIDICEPGTRYNVYEYQKDFIDAYNDITTRGKKVVLCGGTGLYLEAVLRGYRLSPVPQNDNLRQQLEGKTLEELTTILEELKRKNGAIMHNRTDVDTAQRAIRAIEIEEHYLKHPVADRAFPKINSIVIGVDIDREERRKRITRRLKQRLEEGMIEEVKGLIDSGIPPENLIYYGLEYKYVTEHLMGKTTYQEMFTLLEIAIHQFAKRQMTWFRGMEKRGIRIHWLQASLPMKQKVETIKMLAKENLTKTE